MSSTLTHPRVKKVAAFLWNGVWTLDRTGLPMKGVKKKFIQKDRDILPALCNDTLYLIGKEVRGIREGRDRAYHERQYRIYRGLEEMPFNCVEHGAAILHKKVWTRTGTDSTWWRLRRICDSHEDNGDRFWRGRRRCGLSTRSNYWKEQYGGNVKDLIAQQRSCRFYTMPDWEWAGNDFCWDPVRRRWGAGPYRPPPQVLECSICGVRGHTKDNCKGCFRSPPQDPYYSTTRLKVLGLGEGNWGWGI